MLQAASQASRRVWRCRSGHESGEYMIFLVFYVLFIEGQFHYILV
jgi:hypothetical protein